MRLSLERHLMVFPDCEVREFEMSHEDWCGKHLDLLSSVDLDDEEDNGRFSVTGLFIKSGYVRIWINERNQAFITLNAYDSKQISAIRKVLEDAEVFDEDIMVENLEEKCVYTPLNKLANTVKSVLAE